jgi:hypothetical protein
MLKSRSEFPRLHPHPRSASGQLSEPFDYCQRCPICSIPSTNQLTSVNILPHRRLNRALVHSGGLLTLEGPSVLASREHARAIHGLLERVALPAEQVVGVRAVALIVAVAQEERIRAITGPHVGELSSIPERLVGDLRHADRVGCRAWSRVLESFFCGGEHVRLMVWAVDVFAVPASGYCQRDAIVRGKV